MLALAKKNDYVVYNPEKTTNPSLAQVKLCLAANSEKYAVENDNVMTLS